MLKKIKIIAAFALSLGATLLMAACCGPTRPQDKHQPLENKEYYTIKGELKGDAEGISGLKACAYHSGSPKICKDTVDGFFQIKVPKSIPPNPSRTGYSLCVEDNGKTGPAGNSRFQTSCKQIPRHRVPAYIFIEVNEK